MDTISHIALKNNPKYYVYALSYPESMGGHVFYIGKGKRNRISSHEWQAKKGAKSYKCNVIRKIWARAENVVRSILAFFETEQEAYEYEKALIFFMDGLTNQTDGGDGTSGYIPTDELRQKWSETRKSSPAYQEARRKLAESRKGSRHSEETRQRMSESGKKKPPLTEDARRKIVEANTGRHFPKEFGMRVAERNRLRGPTSEETRQKMSDAHKGQKRPPRSEEWRRNMRESHMRRKLGLVVKEMETKYCEHCGDPLPPQPANGRRYKYCHPPKKCKYLARRLREKSH